MADKQWPNIVNQFQNITPSPPRTVAGDIARFIGYGLLILMLLRLVHLLAG